MKSSERAQIARGDSFTIFSTMQESTYYYFVSGEVFVTRVSRSNALHALQATRFSNLSGVRRYPK